MRKYTIRRLLSHVLFLDMLNHQHGPGCHHG